MSLQPRQLISLKGDSTKLESLAKIALEPVELEENGSRHDSVYPVVSLLATNLSAITRS